MVAIIMLLLAWIAVLIAIMDEIRRFRDMDCGADCIHNKWGICSVEASIGDDGRCDEYETEIDPLDTGEAIADAIHLLDDIFSRLDVDEGRDVADVLREYLGRF